MAHNNTAQFLKYWHRIQPVTETAPLRAAFDPGALKTLMPQMLMLSAGQGTYDIRLSGGVIDHLHGPGLRGSDFTHLFSPAFRAPLMVALTSARHREQPLLISATAPISDEVLSLELLLTPLRNTDGLIDRFASLYQPLGAPPTALEDQVPPLAGLLTLGSARLQTSDTLRPAHLRLISLEGQRVA